MWSPLTCLTAASTPVPKKSLDDICATAVAAKIYPQCVRYYPFILGAQPVKMIDLAAFYAAIANEGALPQPHGIDSIAQDGRTIYQYPNTPLPRIGDADPAAFYQLKSILQGVVARGTARRIASLSPYVAGKTGTTENFVDGWFVGFTNDVTVAVWVGYDNADGKRRSLGPNEDRRARRGADLPADHRSGMGRQCRAEGAALRTVAASTARARRHPDRLYERQSDERWQFHRALRRGADGQVADTQYQLVSQDDAYAYQGGESNPFWGGAADNSGRSYYPNRGWQPLPHSRRNNRCRAACLACSGLGTSNRRPPRNTSGAAAELMAFDQDICAREFRMSTRHAIALSTLLAGWLPAFLATAAAVTRRTSRSSRSARRAIRRGRHQARHDRFQRSHQPGRDRQRNGAHPLRGLGTSIPKRKNSWRCFPPMRTDRRQAGQRRCGAKQQKSHGKTLYVCGASAFRAR